MFDIVSIIPFEIIFTHVGGANAQHTQARRLRRAPRRLWVLR